MPTTAMAATIFQNLRLMAAANIFTRGVSQQVSAKYKKRLMYYDRISRLANFAIDQHNNKENANLKFVEGINLNQYPVEGKLYHVFLKAKDGETVNVYKAKIWEQPLLHKLELTEFKLVHDPTDGMASFAIDLHNKKENANLKFFKGVDMWSWRCLLGNRCHIILKAKDGEKVSVYKATIRELSWSCKPELMEFKLNEGRKYRRKYKLARFAVDEYNEQENANLKFVKGVRRKIYFVAGRLYHFTFEASDGERVNVYKAEVRALIYERTGFMLTRFKLVGVGDAPSVDSEKFPKFKSILNSIFLKFRKSVKRIWARGFSQVGQSRKDLTIPTRVKLNPIDPPTTYNLARFAVDKHNTINNKNANLKFVIGIDSKKECWRKRYYVTLEANDGEKVNVYQAEIWEEPCMNEQLLVEFKLVGEAPSLF